MLKPNVSLTTMAHGMYEWACMTMDSPVEGLLQTKVSPSASHTHTYVHINKGSVYVCVQYENWCL